MKPVDQAQFGTKPGKPDAGNCFSACIASILELPITAIPNFATLPDEQDAWDDAIREYLAPFGLWILTLSSKAMDGGKWAPLGYHIISGKSPRGGCLHSVVGFCGKIVHDPHPSRAGLASVETFSVFVALDPLRGRRAQ